MSPSEKTLLLFILLFIASLFCVVLYGLTFWIPYVGRWTFSLMKLVFDKAENI